MTDQQRETIDEDVEAHKRAPAADAETAEGNDDTEDTAGHQKKPKA